MKSAHARVLLHLIAGCTLLAAGTRAGVVPGQEFDPKLCLFQQPINLNAVVDPSGAAAIDANRGADFLITVKKWCYPVYYVGGPGTYRVEDVYLVKNWQPQGHVMKNVPIPTAVELKPDPTSDGHLCIVDTVHLISYDFWACTLTGNRHWRRSTHKGRRLLTAKSADRFYLAGTGASPIALSAKGSGFALVPGLVRPDELRNGFIPHALAMAIAFPASGGPMPPATLSDEESPKHYPKALPDGTRVRLRPALFDDARIDSASWSPVEKTLARALRDYGAFITDSGGSQPQVQLYAENPTYYPDPYAGIPGMKVDSSGAMDLFDRSFFSSANFEVVDAHPQVPYKNVVNADADEDGDGVPDVAEIAFGDLDRYQADPSNAQENPDGDPLTNAAEWRVFDNWFYPSNPHRTDSDLDGVDDAGELVDGTDPTDPFSVDLSPDFASGVFPVPERGTAPLGVHWFGVVRGGTTPFTYCWDFGDGSAPSNQLDPRHSYTKSGIFVATLTVMAGDGRMLEGKRSVAVGISTRPPLIKNVAARGRRNFKLKIRGRGFRSGAVLFIDGTPAPATRVRSPGTAVARKGAALEAMVPTGLPVTITMQNPDGQISAPFTYIR